MQVASPRSNPVPRWRPTREIVALLGLLAIVCLLAYPGMSSPRLQDDNDQLTFVKRFTGWTDIFGPDAYGLFRPVKNLLFWISGDWSLGLWHGFNLGTFLFATACVYALLRRLLGGPGWALAGAAIWATCPTQVSAAVWMTCFNLNLAVAFGCLFLIAHDMAASGRNPRTAYVAGLAMLALAELCYESAVALPVLAVLVDLLRKRPVFARAAISRYGGYALVTLLYLGARSWLGGAHSVQQRNFGFAPDLESWQLAVSSAWIFWRHLAMWLLPPGRLEFCSTYLWGVSAPMWALAAAWGFLACYFAFIWSMWKRERWISIGLLWFFAAGFPSANFVPLYCGPVEDYYLIAPSVGLSIALLGGARLILSVKSRHAGRSRIGWLCNGVLAVGIAWRALGLPLFWRQADLWREPAALYLHYEASRPAQYQLQALAARELLIAGDLKNAKAFAAESRATGPWLPLGAIVLGEIALFERDHDEAIARFEEGAARVAPASTVHDFCQLHKAEAQLARPETRRWARATLLPLLERPGGDYHVPAVELLVEFYLAENDRAKALNAVKKGLHYHPEEESLLSLLKTVESGEALPTERQ